MIEGVLFVGREPVENAGRFFRGGGFRGTMKTRMTGFPIRTVVSLFKI